MPKNKNERSDYDAIVVGSGICGGWAAKELTERGLSTLVLERGRDVRHGADYPTMDWRPSSPEQAQLSPEERERYRKQRRTGYTVRPDTKHWWVDDDENPYVEVKPFAWIRGYHVGGRSITWGRQCYRWTDLDFEANARDGYGVDWPIRYEDLAPWYSRVESFIGVSGQAERWSTLPDGELMPPMRLNSLEQRIRERLASAFPDRLLTIGRAANLTRPHNGRGECKSRNLCMRGCPHGAYFSSNASTLPAAEATGRMTLRPNSIVYEIVYDAKKQRASGVRIIDSVDGTHHEFKARVVFLAASTLGSTFILMNSVSSRFPRGLGNDSGELGHNLMDHNLGAGASAESDEVDGSVFDGRRPNGIYIPRFRNVTTQHPDYLRGFQYQGGASRTDWRSAVGELSYAPGARPRSDSAWTFGVAGFGEHLPMHSNHVTLRGDATDKWGLPLLAIDCEFGANEVAMRKDIADSAAEMLVASGLKNVRRIEMDLQPGLGMHEMGTARMGSNPETSVLNRYNQIHAAKNVFVTDGACMTSSGCQNPSLTYMALTARAAHYAADQMIRRDL